MLHRERAKRNQNKGTYLEHKIELNKMKEWKIHGLQNMNIVKNGKVYLEKKGRKKEIVQQRKIHYWTKNKKTYNVKIQGVETNKTAKEHKERKKKGENMNKNKNKGEERMQKHIRPTLNLILPITFITKFVATFHQLHRTIICHCNGKFGLEFQFQFPI
jgi:hypothetical protein